MTRELRDWWRQRLMTRQRSICALRDNQTLCSLFVSVVQESKVTLPREVSMVSNECAHIWASETQSKRTRIRDRICTKVFCYFFVSFASPSLSPMCWFFHLDWSQSTVFFYSRVSFAVRQIPICECTDDNTNGSEWDGISQTNANLARAHQRSLSSGLRIALYSTLLAFVSHFSLCLSLRHCLLFRCSFARLFYSRQRIDRMNERKKRKKKNNNQQTASCCSSCNIVAFAIYFSSFIVLRLSFLLRRLLFRHTIQARRMLICIGAWPSSAQCVMILLCTNRLHIASLLFCSLFIVFLLHFCFVADFLFANYSK